MKQLVVETVNTTTQTPSLYRYDIDDQEQITVFLSKHNNADEFVATYKVIEDEPCLQHNH